VKWNALQVIPLPHAFHFISSKCYTSINLHQATCNQYKSTLGMISHRWYDPLHVITWPYWFIYRNFACSSSLSWSISTKLSTRASPPRLSSPRASSLPFRVQPVLHSQAMSLDLLHLATWHHVMSHMQWAPSSTLVEYCNKSKPLFHHGSSCSNECTCASHIKHMLVHLSCHSITKTKLEPFSVVALSNTQLASKISNTLRDTGFLLAAKNG